MKAAGIILAAGESRRMGRPKALLPFRDGTFLSVLARTLQPFCEPLIAVAGANPSDVLAACSGPVMMNVSINSAWRQGMITSLQAGLAALEAIPDRVLFTLVDHPAIEASTVAGLLECEAPIVIPRTAGRRGHPVIISREIALEYLEEPLTAQVRDVVNRHADSAVYVEVDDPGINDDIDDPSRYEALLAREAQ